MLDVDGMDVKTKRLTLEITGLRPVCGLDNKGALVTFKGSLRSLIIIMLS